jgi:hypothetical protein
MLFTARKLNLKGLFPIFLGAAQVIFGSALASMLLP